MRQRLTEAGIETGIHYPVPLHLQKVYKELGYKPGDFPVSEQVAKGCLSLPIYPELSREHLEHVISVIRSSLA